MKKYLGVKIVEAEPMSANEFAAAFPLKGKIDPNEDTQGYKVVYEDGYVSWSPKDVFEKAYKELEGLFVHEKIDVFSDGFWGFSMSKTQENVKDQSSKGVDSNHDQELKCFCVDNAIKLQYVTSKSELLEVAKEIYNWIKE